MGRCVIKHCSGQAEPFFENRCPEHSREWLATMDPEERKQALGPILGLPRIQPPSQGAKLSGIIFLEDNNDLPKMRKNIY
jgi:hypothetical protein